MEQVTPTKIDKRIKYPAYIYGIRPKDGEYFYIGSTVQTVEIRFRSHLNDVKAYRHVNPGFMAAIRKYGADSCEIDILEVTTIKKRFVREYAWLSRLERQGIPLTNICKSIKQAEKIAESRVAKQSIDRDGLSQRFLNHVEIALRINESEIFFNYLKDNGISYLDLPDRPPHPHAVKVFRDHVRQMLVESPKFTMFGYGEEAFWKATEMLAADPHASSFGFVTAIAHRPTTALQIYAA